MRTTARRAVQVVCVLTTASLLAACGAGQERPSEDGSAVGVTDTSIKVGAHFPLTGPAAPGYSEIPSGHQAFYEYVNDNGGVHGRDIEMVVKDDAYNPTNTSA
ncbi:MAG TPA: ABC transporter substrate-binding protein, partial [Nocardioides sp.]